MESYIQQYQGYLINKKNATTNTVNSYIRDINQFCDFLHNSNVVSFSLVTKETVENYVNFLHNQEKSSATISRSIASIRGFYQYLILTDTIKDNPVKDIKSQKKERSLPVILTDEEIDLLLAQPNTADFKGARDKAMLELLYATGIKATELIDLNIPDINFRQGVLTCKSEKNQRVIPIYPDALSAIKFYLDNVRVILANEDSEYSLFINMNGKRLTRQGFWKIIKGYAETANIDKEITPQILRHSFASHLIDNGADVQDVKEMLGHADISSTYMYVNICNDHNKDIYNNCHPKAKKTIKKGF